MTLIDKASFWRGGTSRGLILLNNVLKKFPRDTQDDIVRQAMGSPDPAGRQINGLGGGASSLSKICLIGAPGQGLDGYDLPKAVPWAERGYTDNNESYDVIFRLGQVGIRDSGIDWQATCGNMASAVAQYAVENRLVDPSELSKRAQETGTENVQSTHVSILAAGSGSCFKAHVLVDKESMQPWKAPQGQGVSIAGVPGEGAPIKLEFPLEHSDSQWVGNHIAALSVDDHDIPITIASVGLPNVFVLASSLEPFLKDKSQDYFETLLTRPSSELDADAELMKTIEKIRTQAAHQNGLELTLASPKVTLIGPPLNYQASNGDLVSKKDYDILARAISSGQFHASIPGTTLGALNVASGFDKSLVASITKFKVSQPDREVTIRVGHASGITDSCVKFNHGHPSSVLMIRTAREIMQGSLVVDI